MHPSKIGPALADAKCNVM